MRYTPAGIAAIEGRLSHEGHIDEAGQARNLQFEIAFIGLGGIAAAIGEANMGQAMRFEGFMARKSRNSRTLVFHITGFERIDN